MTVIIIGGGIVGLAAARELLLTRPGLQIHLLEKEPEIAQHQTGHNSSVIHSGIYYPAGSEKALRVREGIRLLTEFSDRHHIPRKKAGKLIVATDASEVPGLQKLFEQGQANQIPGLRMISAEELKEREPALTGLEALYLPDVELIDYKLVSHAIKKEILERGGKISLMQKVDSIREKNGTVQVRTEKEEYIGNFLVNCGGLYSDWIARRAGCNVPARIIPFRGEYFFLKDHVGRKVRALVYPVPDPRFPFLGVHLTPTVDGRMTAGPNAVLALAREGYGWGRMNLAEIGDYLSYPGFWQMAGRYWKTGVFETVRSLVKSIYAASVRKFMPEIQASDLLPGPSGVRAQAVDPKGQCVHDFLYQLGAGAVREPPLQLHILNAPSPAATASLAIAKKIAELVP